MSYVPALPAMLASAVGETPQLLRPIDSPIVSNGLVEREDVSAGDSLTSPLPGSERRTAGPRTAEVAAITPLGSSDPDALATLLKIPGSLRARWQQRYGSWLAVSDVIVVSGVVAAAHILRFGNVTSGSLWAGYASVAYSAVSVLIVLAWALVLAIYHTRAQQVVGAGPEEFRRVWTATLWVFGVIAIISTLFKLEIARGYLAIAFPLGLFALSVNRRLARVFRRSAASPRPLHDRRSRRRRAHIGYGTGAVADAASFRRLHRSRGLHSR